MLYYCAVGDDHDYIYLNPSGAHIVLEVEDEVLNVVKNLLMNKRVQTLRPIETLLYFGDER